MNPQYSSTTFSPLALRYALLESLRYFFGRVTREDLRYSPDPAETRIVVNTSNTEHQDTAVQKKPRILVKQGGYRVSRSGLTDNLAESDSANVRKGALDQIHMVMVNGVSTIIIEAEEEGTTLILADMVSCVFTWNSQHICDAFGFKNFGFPLQVSDIEQSKEDTEKYIMQVQVPWVFESSWSLKEDALKMKDFFLNFKVTN